MFSENHCLSWNKLVHWESENLFTTVIIFCRLYNEIHRTAMGKNSSCLDSGDMFDNSFTMKCTCIWYFTCWCAASALRVMYSSLGTPGQLSQWNSNGGDPCGESWKGVTCSGSRVTEMWSSMHFFLNSFWHVSSGIATSTDVVEYIFYCFLSVNYLVFNFLDQWDTSSQVWQH